MENERLKIAKNLSNDIIDEITIGIQKEKILHKILKYYLSNDVNNHEKKVGRMYADVIIDNHIYEIQTQNFNMMRHKLDVFLPNYQVTIVFPVIRIKQILNINEYGEFIKEKKSPRKGTPFDLMVEQYKIKNMLKHPNLSFKIIYLDADEYRTIVPKVHFRSKGYTRYKQVPTNIVKEYNLNNKNDYLQILNEFNIPDAFTVKDFSKITKQSYKKSATTVNVLASIEVVELMGKQNRSNLWKIKK